MRGIQEKQFIIHFLTSEENIIFQDQINLDDQAIIFTAS